jgi:hypothetical protein
VERIVAMLCPFFFFSIIPDDRLFEGRLGGREEREPHTKMSGYGILFSIHPF